MEKFILSAILCISASLFSYAQDCAEFLKKKQSSYSDGYEYRNQSSFATIRPGDTVEVNAILYANKLYKIFAKNTAESPYNVKIYKAYRTYARKLDSISYKKSRKKIFKLDDNGQKIPLKSADGTPKIDSYGDTLFTVSDYITTEITDTLWKMEKVTERHIIYNSEDNNIPVYEQRNKRTQSIIIQVTMPKDIKTAKISGDCIAIMVGRKE